jgi:CRISPR-associated protein Csb1
VTTAASGTTTPTRLVYQADLEPVLGSTFQPTGFPDLGAAVFERFTGGEDAATQQAVLVESVQSMANRLEATAWDKGAQRPADAVTGLPYVEVVRAGTGEFLTSSRLEAHRLASAFVRDSTLDSQAMVKVISGWLESAKDTPLNFPAMARAIMGVDPFCLLHGVFFAHKDWYGQPRFARAVSAVIEAHDVRRVVSGGRKSDQVRHQLDRENEGGGTAEGYGSVPFSRVEFTARSIVATFVIDNELLGSYGLPAEAVELLRTLAQWEIRTFLDHGLRLRTACDLALVNDVEGRRGTDELPGATALTSRLRSLISANAELLGEGGPLTVQWNQSKAKA